MFTDATAPDERRVKTGLPGGAEDGLGRLRWPNQTTAAEEVHMTLHHSEETHHQLVAKVPGATGRDLKEWFGVIENGPALSFDDKVNWLRDEYDISHGHATAIVHAIDLAKAARRTS
jgi:hypothetical protein